MELKRGDGLLVTQNAHDQIGQAWAYAELDMDVFKKNFPVGDVFRVEGLNREGRIAIRGVFIHYGPGVPIEIAEEMRAAFLEEYPDEETEDGDEQ